MTAVLLKDNKPKDNIVLIADKKVASIVPL